MERKSDGVGGLLWKQKIMNKRKVAGSKCRYDSKKKEKKQKEINLFDTEAILWQLQGWGEYISCGNHVGNTV